MNSTTKTLKTNAALKQIEVLRVERDRIQSNWLALGYEKTAKAVEAIGEQIVALYEEIDAIEADETTQANRSENKVGCEDEVGLSRREVEMMKKLGWTIEDVKRASRKARR